jgi:XTP/dITP diphosphohydrolase
MTKTITFITGNQYKFEIAKKALVCKDISLEQVKLEVPEIQATDVSKIASFSAKWACEKLRKPVVVTDVGWYIESLNGFPGPYIKYINHWLTSEDLIKLMKGNSNRKIVVRGCLAYCDVGKNPICFMSEVYGNIADKPVKKNGASAIDEIFIPNGFDKVSTEIPREEMDNFWKKTENYWQDLANIVLNDNS